MSRVAFSTGLTVVLAFCLGGCNPARDTFDHVQTTRPTAKMERLTVGVGEPIEVTLATAFGLPEQSQVPERSIKGIVMSACFGTDIAPSNSLNNAGGYCDPNESDTPPAWITLTDGSSHVLDVPDVVVKRGQEETVEHTFSLTRNEPGEVVIAPTLYYTAEGDGPAFVSGAYLTVTFE